MAVHGKNTAVWLDDQTGTPVKVDAYLRGTDASEKIDTADTSNFGQNDKTYVLGMGDETVSMDGTFDPSFIAQVRAVKSAIQAGTLASATLKIGWSGSATGMANESREVLPTSIQVSSTTKDVVTAKLDFQRTGPTTFGTF